MTFICYPPSKVVLLGVLLPVGFILGGVLLCVALESYKLAHQVLVHVHHSRVVVEVSAVVLRTENSHQLFVLSKEPVPVLHHLVATANQVQVVPAEELLQLLAPEHVAAAALVLLPIPSVVVGVVPK